MGNRDRGEIGAGASRWDHLVLFTNTPNRLTLPSCLRVLSDLRSDTTYTGNGALAEHNAPYR